MTSGPGWRSMGGGEIDARIELDPSLRREAEGGVALDADGKAFGMTAFGPRRRVFAIPAATVARVASHLETHGRIARGYLGLGLQPVRLHGDRGMGTTVMSILISTQLFGVGTARRFKWGKVRRRPGERMAG